MHTREDEDRNWGSAVTSQAVLRSLENHQNTTRREGGNRVCLYSFEEKPITLTPGFWTSKFYNYRTINFCC